jgi:GNAT superfamily N-acetyltransferase
MILLSMAMVNGPQIREAGSLDVPMLARVHLRTVVSSYAGLFPPDAPVPTLGELEARWASDFDSPSVRVFLAEVDAEPVGTVAVRAQPHTARVGELRRLHVLPDVWNAGIGSALHDVAIGTLAKAGYTEAAIWVLEGNSRARNFYEHRGWMLVGGAVHQWPKLGVIVARYRLPLGRPC